jgi:cell division protease FtsH
MTATRSLHALTSSAAMPASQTPKGVNPAATAPETAPLTPNWRPFAEAILAAVEGCGWAGWRVSASAKPGSDLVTPAQDAARTAAQTSKSGSAASATANTATVPDADDTLSVDDLLDQIEAAADLGPLLPPCPPMATEPATLWRPKAATLLSAVRLAATFGSADALAATLGQRGAVTLLATGSAALDYAVKKTVEQVVAELDIWPQALPAPEVLYAPDAVRTGSPERNRTLGSLTDKAREAIEKGSPLLLVTTVAGTAPREVRALNPQVFTLAPLDRAMLAVLLDMAYPGQQAAAALAALPGSARVSRLDPDQATLALRAANPEAAVRAITAYLCPPPSEGAGWAQFPLPKSVRDPLESMIRDLRDWQEGRIVWRDVARGPLLVGPPGSGKTQIARLLAEEAGVAVVAGSVAQWSSESSRSSDMIRAMRAAFATAAEQAPAILYIDEIDSFGDRARPRDHNSAYTDYVVGALLDLLDGFEGHEGVVVMAATNHPEKLDKAIVRPGRFDRILTLPHPDITLLPKAIRWQLGADLPDADLSAVAQAALGVSGADIAAAVRSARGAARRDRRDLTLDDLAAAITEARPPLHPELRRIVAAHEAGHAIVGTATGYARVSTVAIRSDGGSMTASLANTGEDRALIETMLAINLAGRAAERLVFGRITTGGGGDPESDLAKSTRLAIALETSWGLGESLIWLGPVDGGAARLRDDPNLRARVETHLRNAEARATRILTANRKLLAEMSASLEATGVLSGPALAALLDRVVLEPAASRAPEGAMPESHNPVLTARQSVPCGKSSGQGPDTGHAGGHDQMPDISDPDLAEDGTR